MANEKPPTGFTLPDLIASCAYPLQRNQNCDSVARESEQWLLEAANHDERRREKFMGLKAGQLTASCYPDANYFHLRVCDDFMNYLFNLDDWLDEFDPKDTHGLAHCCISAMRDPINFQTEKRAGLMTKSFFGRLSQTAGSGCKERFIYSMELFFAAVAQQSSDREQGVTPDLESYINIRRDTSGCKPCFQLIEFCAGIDLPDMVINHPNIRALEEATNDLITWSNDIFSYNVEQSRDDTHNMIPVIMAERELSLQPAVDFVGQCCQQSIDRFEVNCQNLPTWGPEIDREVALYVQGLQNWIVGSLHWSFESERYFGKHGGKIKEHRFIKLLPKKLR